MLDRLTTPLNASRVHLDGFLDAAGRSVPAGSRVLDAGAGESIYRHHFAHTTYEAADFALVDKPYADDLTYVCDLRNIPVEAGRYDLIVLTQVLEHLPEPLEVLRELRRVTRTGGRIWASCPLYHEEHEQPFDFYRFTQFSLRRIFLEAGFGEPRIDWLEGYLATVSYQLEIMGREVPRRAAPLKLALKLASELCARSDVRRKRTDIGHPKNYTIVATAT